MSCTDTRLCAIEGVTTAGTVMEFVYGGALVTVGMERGPECVERHGVSVAVNLVLGLTRLVICEVGTVMCEGRNALSRMYVLFVFSATCS